MTDHLLLIGPPGSKKTMYARHLGDKRRPGSIAKFHGKDPYDAKHARARSYIRRVAGLANDPENAELDRIPPFRAPHHTCSTAALLGTVIEGWMWRPGELSIAHGGMLFLDELPEFRLDAINTLKEPLERGQVTYHGTKHHFSVPADFRLVAAMNPCPCGWYGTTRDPGNRDVQRVCKCSAEQRERYRARIPEWLMAKLRVVEPDELAAKILLLSSAS